MKRIAYLLVICLILSGCANTSGDRSVTVETAEKEITEVETTVEVTTEEVTTEEEATEVEPTQEETPEKETTEKETTDKYQETTDKYIEITDRYKETTDKYTEHTEADTEEEDTTEEDTTEEDTKEQETTVKETTTAPTEPTTTTEPPTTEPPTTEAPTEPPTTAPYPVEIVATVNGTHYLGDKLSAGDFSVSIRYSDGNVIDNPNGWSASPLDVALGDNYVEVKKDGLSTVVTYYAGERPTEPPTEPPTEAPTEAPPAPPVYQPVQPPPAGETVTIVLDPGHGGSDPGAIANGLQEKDLTLKVAFYCRAYLLENYDGIDIIMTRIEDNFVDLKSRCEFAEWFNGNCTVSFHFNASDAHTGYGTEVLVSQVPGVSGYAATLGNYILNELSALGLSNRGLVTRELSPGVDYYAINRYSAEYGKVGVIIENCFMDSANDIGFCNTEEALKALGEADARGIAAYLGKSHK